MTEIELKLELDEEGAAALEASELLQHAEVLELGAVYFDTADRRLHRAGAALRIRTAQGRRVQTLKTGGGGAAGLFDRGEWERQVEEDIPVVDPATPLPEILGEEALAPVFAVTVTRRQKLIATPAGGVEIALDRGEVTAGAARTPVREVELELKSGDPAVLFALARRVREVAAVRIGVLAKSDRGHLLAEGPPAAYKSSPVALQDGMTAGEAFRAVVLACLRQFRLNEDLLRESRAPEALHQARVALRRLRSAFSVFRPAIGGDRAAVLRADLRWLAGTLGEARDIDVLAGRAEEPLRGHLLAAREAAYDRAEAALASARARDLLLDLIEWLVTGDWLTAEETAEVRDAPLTDFAVRALTRRRRRLKRDGEDLEKATDEARHELRKEAKKLRYAVEFFAALFATGKTGRRRARFAAGLEALQDRLGDLNDLATAPELLRELGLEEEAAALPSPGKRKRLIRDAAEAHEDLMDEKRFWK